MKELYLSSWNYNSYLIIKELKKEVLKEGGSIVCDWRKEKEKNFYIYNRMFHEKYLHDIESMKRMEEYKTTDKPYYKKLEKEAEEAKKNFEKSKKRLNNSNYLHFVLNDCIYYIELSDNPFFDFYYSKQPINNLITDCIVYSECMDKDFMTFDYFGKVGKTKIKNSAMNLLELLKKSKTCKPYKQKKTVYNILESEDI